jgi:predicted Zn-ribbon and HTH transcriptional regulator
MKKTNSHERFTSDLMGVLKDLPPRAQQIIMARFGVDGKKPRTLEKIGNQYGITRERVRQILQNSIKNIKKKHAHKGYDRAVGEIEQRLRSTSGLRHEKHLIEDFGIVTPQEAGSLRFFLYCHDSVCEIKLPQALPALTLPDFAKDTWETVHTLAHAYFQEKNEPVDEDMLKRDLAQGLAMEPETIVHYLSVSKEIAKSPFGKWGLSSWNSINPRGVREKIYLVLQQDQEPLHFRTIAERIDAYGLGKNRKATHPQTVHNELIKDRRFVLVGRGIYALSEWGYDRGTVRDVVQSILTHSNRPMAPEEILAEVLKVREVKKSTVLVNLKTFFERNAQNCYTVRDKYTRDKKKVL